MPNPPREDGRARGQVLIMFALALVVLLGFAGLAVDVGRLVAERRHVQNAADAGALAACVRLIDGGTDAEAAQAGREVALLNLAGSPAAATETIAPDGAHVPAEASLAGRGNELTSGVLIETETRVVGTSVTVIKRARVAIESSVATTFGRVVGVDDLGTSARARCGMEGGPTVPIVARRHINSPGPNDPDCGAAGQHTFVDHLATAATSTCGGADETNVLGYGGRTPASETSPGPVFSLYGPDSKASNDPSFRGFIAVDIRNFASTTSRRYYNGVDAGTNANLIKQKEGDYILARYYPGPPFPPVVSPPDPNAQVAVLSGNDTSMVVGNFETVYKVGDVMVLAVYGGTVKAIPDFSLTPPPTINLPATATTPTDGPSFTVARNDSFVGTVELHLHGDDDAPDPTDDIVDETALLGIGVPLPGKINQPGWNPAAGPTDGFRPTRQGTTVTMKDFRTNAVPPGIYTAWLEGHSASPYNTTRRQPVTVLIGGTERDFSLGNSVTAGQTSTLGGNISMDLYVSTAKTSDPTNWGAAGTAVNLSIDADTLPAGMAVAPSFSSPSVVPSVVSKPGNPFGTKSVLTINSGGLAAGTYNFVVRAKGTNGAGQPVTHLLPIVFSVVNEPSAGNYVDITGFAVFEVTEVTANGIEGRAISPIAASSEDWALRRALRARLISWTD
ncbi:MAG: Tad domain-containing protein [Chloroflexota bacterium]|nr:Tad domain-containing protein [Chloroflexota bacterium]